MRGEQQPHEVKLVCGPGAHSGALQGEVAISSAGRHDAFGLTESRSPTWHCRMPSLWRLGLEAKLAVVCECFCKLSSRGPWPNACSNACPKTWKAAQEETATDHRSDGLLSVSEVRSPVPGLAQDRLFACCAFAEQKQVLSWQRPLHRKRETGPGTSPRKNPGAAGFGDAVEPEPGPAAQRENGPGREAVSEGNAVSGLLLSNLM